MRRFLYCTVSALPAALWAQGLATGADANLGTKPDIVTQVRGGAPSMSLMPLLQMALAAGVILLLLKFLLPKMLMKFNKGLKGHLNGGIRIEEAASFAGGTLNVVTARGKTLLLCVGGQGVTFLADLTEARAEPDPPTFSEMLETKSATMSREPDTAPREGFATISATAMEGDDSSERNERLPSAAATGDLRQDEIEAALKRAKLLAL